MTCRFRLLAQGGHAHRRTKRPLLGGSGRHVYEYKCRQQDEQLYSLNAERVTTVSIIGCWLMVMKPTFGRSRSSITNMTLQTRKAVMKIGSPVRCWRADVQRAQTGGRVGSGA